MSVFGSGRDWLIKIKTETTDASGGLQKTQGAVGGLTAGLGKLAGAVGGALAVGAIVDFGKQSVDAFAKAEQAAGGVETVFGDAAGSVNQFAGDSADRLGLATAEYQSLATLVGGNLFQQGFTNLEQLAGTTDDVATRAADLAAAYGGNTTQVVEAFNSAINGSTEPLRQFNVNLSDAEIRAQAVEMGLANTAAEVDKNAKAQATLALFMEQSANVAGQFASESDTLAGKQERLAARFQDLQVRLGEQLAPIMEVIFELFEALFPVIEPLLPVIASLAKILVQILGPALELVGGLIDALVKLITGDFDGAWDTAENAIDGFVSAFEELWRSFLRFWNRIDIKIGPFTIPGWVPGVGGKTFSIPDLIPDVAIPFAAGGIVRGPTLGLLGESGPEAVIPLGSGGLGPTYNIVVNAGVGDPVEIGRTVVDMIAQYERVNGPTWRAG